MYWAPMTTPSKQIQNNQPDYLCVNTCVLLVSQVKIWFQNRRAKERKQVKKREELMHKEKLEAVSAAHLQHAHQQMAAAAVAAAAVGAPPPSHGVVM